VLLECADSLISSGASTDYWKGCSVTAFPRIDLLVASHIKPWKASNNFERLDVFNGLLLLPNLDRAFELGYISFNEKGTIIISPTLEHPELIGIDSTMRLNVASEQGSPSNEGSFDVANLCYVATSLMAHRMSAHLVAHS
jgi:HNH endonuclease